MVYYKMPIYSCECCKYSTAIKTQYERHNSTTKHLNNINKPVVEDEGVPTTKDNTDSIDMLFDEIAFLKQENAEMKIALQECKQLIADMKNFSSTPPSIPQVPHQIIISQQAPEEKPPDETCNPRYIEKTLDEECGKHEDIHSFFSFKSDNIVLDFDDIDEPCSITKKYAIDKITEAVKNKLEVLPFKYVKSSWYIKQQDGWKREEYSSNKNIQSTSNSYTHSIIVKKLLYIFKINVIKYYDNIMGSTDWRGVGSNFAELASETLDVVKYTNSDVLTNLKQLF